MPKSNKDQQRRSENTEQWASQDEKVEQASKESFPASDSPSYTRSPRGQKEKEEREEDEEHGERERDERAPRGGQRGPRHSSTDPSEREETE